MPVHRNSAKAIIIQNRQLLTIRNRDLQGDFYILPGGGQQHRETLHETLHRECKEEISADVVIGPLQFVREYIGENHEFAEHDGDVHQIEFMFRCDLKEDQFPATGPLLDAFQVGISWLPVAQLEQYRLYPAVLRELVKIVVSEEIKDSTQIYLGDVN
jgi:8-oxo-dGTP pyrophosphatase MutT (NUDIX family)